MAAEHYISCHAPGALSPEQAIARLRSAFDKSLADRGLDPSAVVLFRFFCSDVYTHAPMLERLWPVTTACQCIYLGQQPQDSAFISLQAYCIDGFAEKHIDEDGNLSICHGSYTSLWSQHYPHENADSRVQSDIVIQDLQRCLKNNDLLLERDVVRTWYYMRDVDNNYAGMVQSRTAQYENCGLLPSTHFIASTGIEGCARYPHALVWLQSHAEVGLVPQQITYLKALDHLSPTQLYAVNFERATLIRFGDREHCRISGTASIDHAGNVLFKGDVIRQLRRAVENITALLNEGNMGIEDMKSAVVYLRDGHDYGRIAPLLQELLPSGCAINVTRAPVCRPDWLVEIEGEAVRLCTNEYPPF